MSDPTPDPAVNLRIFAYVSIALVALIPSVFALVVVGLGVYYTYYPERPVHNVRWEFVES